MYTALNWNSEAQCKFAANVLAALVDPRLTEAYTWLAEVLQDDDSFAESLDYYTRARLANELLAGTGNGLRLDDVKAVAEATLAISAFELPGN